MPDLRQLPYLVRLFDDSSPTVRRSVLAELDCFGAELEVSLAQLIPPLDEQRRAALFDALDSFSAARDSDAASTPDFAPGQLVQHRSYGYRGVVVEVDQRCLAEDSWYQSNKTQPARDQPWYHVLVHSSLSVTYAAETSLAHDPSGEEVVHPYVPYFFSSFESGIYLRNDRPWREDH